MAKTIAIKVRRDDHAVVNGEAGRLVTEKKNIWSAMRLLWQDQPEELRRQYLERVPGATGEMPAAAVA